MTVSELTVSYLIKIIKASGYQAIDIWDYHSRKHKYAKNARDEDILETKCLGRAHLDAVNLSAYEWMSINDPEHSWVKKYEKQICECSGAQRKI